MDYVEGTDAARLLESQYPSGMSRPDIMEVNSAGTRHSITPIPADCCMRVTSNRPTCL